MNPPLRQRVLGWWLARAVTRRMGEVADEQTRLWRADPVRWQAVLRRKLQDRRYRVITPVLPPEAPAIAVFEEIAPDDPVGSPADHPAPSPFQPGFADDPPAPLVTMPNEPVRERKEPA